MATVTGKGTKVRNNDEVARRDDLPLPDQRRRLKLATQSNDGKSTFTTDRKANRCDDWPPPGQSSAAARAPHKPGGVSLTDDDAGDWLQANSLRAALNGLRKTSVILTRRREGGNTIYEI